LRPAVEARAPAASAAGLDPAPAGSLTVGTSWPANRDQNRNRAREARSPDPRLHITGSAAAPRIDRQPVDDKKDHVDGFGRTSRSATAWRVTPGPCHRTWTGWTGAPAARSTPHAVEDREPS